MKRSSITIVSLVERENFLCLRHLIYVFRYYVKSLRTSFIMFVRSWLTAVYTCTKATPMSMIQTGYWMTFLLTLFNKGWRWFTIPGVRIIQAKDLAMGSIRSIYTKSGFVSSDKGAYCCKIKIKNAPII